MCDRKGKATRAAGDRSRCNPRVGPESHPQPPSWATAARSRPRHEQSSHRAPSAPLPALASLLQNPLRTPGPPRPRLPPCRSPRRAPALPAASPQPPGAHPRPGGHRAGRAGPRGPEIPRSLPVPPPRPRPQPPPRTRVRARRPAANPPRRCRSAGPLTGSAQGEQPALRPADTGKVGPSRAKPAGPSP